MNILFERKFNYLMAILHSRDWINTILLPKVFITVFEFLQLTKKHFIISNFGIHQKKIFQVVRLKRDNLTT